jgi:gliding motility-associated-like protein
MRKLLVVMLLALTQGLRAQCDMQIIDFNPETLDISIAIISGENCGSPTDSIGEFLLGITTDPPLDPDGFPPCFYDNGWALLVFPVNFVLVDINAPGPYLQSGDIINFNIIDAFIAGSDASLCWQETINNGFFQNYCWQLAITQINDSHPFPYDNGTGLGGFNYPDVTPENNIISFSPFDPDCNTLNTGEPNPCLDPTLYIPNAFTPNNDGKNESFRASISSPAECWLMWEFQIYNRWGTLLFESNYPGQQWRGDVDGGDYFAPDGVYIWKLRARHRYGQTYEEQGHVTIFR